MRDDQFTLGLRRGSYNNEIAPRALAFRIGDLGADKAVAATLLGRYGVFGVLDTVTAHYAPAAPYRIRDKGDLFGRRAVNVKAISVALQMHGCFRSGCTGQRRKSILVSGESVSSARNVMS